MAPTEIQANSGSVRQVGTGYFYHPALCSMDVAARQGERGGAARFEMEVGAFFRLPL